MTGPAAQALDEKTMPPAGQDYRPDNLLAGALGNGAPTGCKVSAEGFQNTACGAVFRPRQSYRLNSRDQRAPPFAAGGRNQPLTDPAAPATATAAH